MTAAQKKAVARHRERLKRRGFVRLEVLARRADAALIRGVAKALREQPDRVGGIEARLQDAIGLERKPNLLELLAADEHDVDLEEFLVRTRDLGRDIDL